MGKTYMKITFLIKKFISRKYKPRPKLNNKKTINQLKNGQKIRTSTLPNKTYGCQITTKNANFKPQ